MLSMLESEEDEPIQDLSSLITSLQQGLSLESLSGIFLCLTTMDTNEVTASIAVKDYNFASCSFSSSNLLKDEEDIIRHLLEASNDENDHGDFDKEVGVVELVRCGGEDLNGGGDELPAWSNGLWELEDEAAK
ncbi:hypothetical protein SLEP1_g23568 [Rubroshorea leprosula]|uniref:Uncharacterized protein n=1 Tax=Rubroshorea leprosula TaxID=152421 RepID=A0AAV5JMB2_9ROSI|nr:hypothetical protein SLEP1_g23568 [Rubroshorea leprosula]